MPIIKETFERYHIIYTALRNAQYKYPTKEQLLEIVSKSLGHTAAHSHHRRRFVQHARNEDLAYLFPMKYDKDMMGNCYIVPNSLITSIPLVSS